jgi:enoyl-CoA hydratase/carnithine racemase
MVTIDYEKRGHVAVITMQGDNDLNIGVVSDPLHQRIAEYASDDDAWCAIVTGAGDRAFSAGGDAKKRAAVNAGMVSDGNEGNVWSQGYGANTILTGMELWKPLVAAVNGYCIGAGLALALACDIRLASENAEFSMPEMKLGAPGGLGVPQRLPRLIAMGPALEMLLTGDLIDAQQALQWNLVNRVVPRGKVLDAALELAERICANPPLGVRQSKEVVYRSLEMPFADGIRLHGLLTRANRETEDAKEAFRARTEKRKPEYKGR